MEVIPRTIISHDWITLLLLCAFILIALVKTTYSYRFADFIMLLVTNKYLLLRGKEPKIFDSFNILMFIVNIISVSIFIFLMYKSFTEAILIKPIIIFIRIATAYTTFVLLKFSVEKIIANIFSIDEKIDFYLFYKLSYRNFLALLLIPVNLIFIYIWSPNFTAWMLMIALIILANMVISLSIIKKNQRYILNHGFYFILYLCALQIGPYYILYKLITK